MEQKADRLRHKVHQQAPAGLDRAPLAGLRLDAVQDAVGTEVLVIIEEIGKVIGAWVRDAVGAQTLGITGRMAGLPGDGARDGIASGRGPP